MTLLVAIGLFAVELALGSFLLRRTGFRFQTRVEECAFGFVLGYGLMGYLVLIVGLLGILYFEVMAGILLVLAAVFVVEIFQWIKQAGTFVMWIIEQARKNKLLFLVCLSSMGVALLALAQALIPPTAHDALCYHLSIPKYFVAGHRIEHMPYLVNSLFPFLIEMHFTLGLLLGNPELANLAHLACGFALFAGVTAAGARIHTPLAGVLAGLIVILTPGIFNQMLIAYNDVGLACFTFFAVYAFMIAWESKRPLLWLGLAGIFSGFALSVKYLALLHIGILGLGLIVWAFVRRVQWQVIVKAVLVYGSMVTLFSFVWYLRAFLHEGNPVYPFFPSIFGGIGKEYDFAKAGYGKGVLDFLLVLWRMTMEPSKFGGTWAQCGILFLAFLPCVLMQSFKKFPVKFMGIFCLVFFILWFFLVQNLRFLFPVIPWLAILIALSTRRAGAWLALVLIMHLVFAVYHGKKGYTYLLGQETRDAYLTREERTYPIALWMRENIPLDARVLTVGEVRLFYFDQRLVREGEFRKKTGYDKMGSQPEKILELLAAGGISYVMMTRQKDADVKQLPFAFKFFPKHGKLKILIPSKDYIYDIYKLS